MSVPIIIICFIIGKYNIIHDVFKKAVFSLLSYLVVYYDNDVIPTGQ